MRENVGELDLNWCARGSSLLLPITDAGCPHCVGRFGATNAVRPDTLWPELGYLSFSRAGAELLFQVFADRYERHSLLITRNFAFSDWGQILQGDPDCVQCLPP